MQDKPYEPNPLSGHDPLSDKKFRTLKITGRTAKLTTNTTDDRHTAMSAYKETLHPPVIEKEPDWSKADPFFRPADYQSPTRQAGGKRKAIDPSKPKYKEKNDRLTLRVRKENLHDIGLMNFCKENSSFVTLTIDPAQYPANNLAFCHKAFQNFIRNIKNHYSNVAYIVVYERTEGEPPLNSTRFHIHLLWNVIDLSSSTLQKCWKKGYVDAKKDFTSVRSILTYMGKNLDMTEKCKHAYDYSRNLHTATVYRESKGEADKIDQFFTEQQASNNLKPVYHTKFTDTKFVTDAEYQYFHLNTPHTNYVPIAELKKPFR